MRILIIGASSGIGRELAMQYATKGNEVIAVARREPLLRELSQYSSNIRIAQCDISNIEGNHSFGYYMFRNRRF